MPFFFAKFFNNKISSVYVKKCNKIKGIKQFSNVYILYIYVDDTREILTDQINKFYIHTYLTYYLLLTHEEIETDFRGTLKSSFFFAVFAQGGVE